MMSARYHLKMGDAFSDENQPELALLEYERALDFKPDWDVALAKIKVEKSPGRGKWRELDLKTELAREMSDDGDSEGALALYLDIQDEFPRYYLPYNNAGSILLSMGRFDDGIAMLLKSLSLLDESEWADDKMTAGIWFQIGAAQLGRMNRRRHLLRFRD